jgi:1-acyl-sn-glycerol-3-phosphate acyltransferase
VAWLYDAVAAGMWGYGHAAFRLAVLGHKRLPLEPGTLIVSTHRRETDVPLVAPAIYGRARLWRRRRPVERMAFAARDDMFLPGFFAGFAPGLSPRVRRALFPVGVGRWLPRIQVHPLRSASVARLGEVLRELGDVVLADALPAAHEEEFRRRATECGLAPPLRARDALRGEYADLLWQPVSSSDLRRDDLEPFWSRRAIRSAADFRTLVELLRSGGILVVFPEGRPSPDGDIGPIRRGLAALVRRARPIVLQPVAPAYDPLTRGRTRALVALGDPVPPPASEIDDAVLALLRRTTPLTCGQIVASLGGERPQVRRSREVEAAVEAALDVACAQGRSVDPDLLRPDRRRRRVEDALAAAPKRPEAVAYLAREYRSARA